MPTVTITENTTGTYTGCVDTQLTIDAPTTNFSTLNELRTTAGTDETPLFKFTGLSNIPATATVTAVTVRLYEVNLQSSTNTIFYRMLRNWVATEATLNVWSSGNNWSTAGGLGSGTDRASSASATLSKTANNGYKEFSDSGLVTDVQNWVSGANANYGWQIRDSANYTFFSSSEGTNGQRPELVVTYTEAGGGSYPYSVPQLNRRHTGRYL